MTLEAIIHRLRVIVHSQVWLLVAFYVAISPAKACVNLPAAPMPVNFETSTSGFSETGKRYVEELLAAVRKERPEEITLVGYTDDRGGDEYNMRLSERRAKAVAKFLTSNGIIAKITTIGKGKSEPFLPTDPAQFTRQEIRMLNRRVVARYEVKTLPSTEGVAATRC